MSYIIGHSMETSTAHLGTNVHAELDVGTNVGVYVDSDFGSEDTERW